MRASDLPSLHTFIQNGFAMSREITKAINSVKLYKMRTGKDSAAAAKLKAYFEAALVALETDGPGVAPAPAEPPVGPAKAAMEAPVPPVSDEVPLP